MDTAGSEPSDSVETDRQPEIQTGWLPQIDAAIDWSRFDDYLPWVDSRPLVRARRHTPLMLFKAFLLQHWFALLSIEIDQEISARPVFRQFIGLEDGQPTPSTDAVGNFRRLLQAKGVAVEIFGELRRQLVGLRLAVFPSQVGDGPSGDDRSDAVATDAPKPLKGRLPFGDLPVPPAVLADTFRFLGPPEWRELEQQLVEFWTTRCRDGKIPSLDDIKLGDLAELGPHLVLIRVMGGQRYRYELVGSEVSRNNQCSLLGASIDGKGQENIQNRGHIGLQGELAATFDAAVKLRRPTGTSVYFENAAGTKCQVWTALAPLTDSQGDVTMLLGIAEIRPVPLN